VTASRAAVFGLILAGLTCLPCTSVAGSVDGPLADYTVTTWSENDGLPAGRVRTIAQDPDGYLWLGTDSGLVRFDGVRFDAWSALGEPRLPVGAVTALLTARDRSLWIGVNGRMPLGQVKDGKLTLYGERDGFTGGYTLSLLEDRGGPNHIEETDLPVGRGQILTRAVVRLRNPDVDERDVVFARQPPDEIVLRPPDCPPCSGASTG